MQLIIVQKLVQAIRSRIILFILPMHYVDVVDKLSEEALHAFGSRSEFHDLVEWAISFRLRDLPVDLKVFLEAL